MNNLQIKDKLDILHTLSTLDKNTFIEVGTKLFSERTKEVIKVKNSYVDISTDLKREITKRKDVPKEKKTIKNSLISNNGNAPKVAKELNMNIRTLYNKINRYKLKSYRKDNRKDNKAK